MLRSEVDRLRGQLTASHDPSAPDGMIFHYVKPHIEEFVNYFRGASNDAEFQFKLAKWFFDHERYSNGSYMIDEKESGHVREIWKEPVKNTNRKKKDEI